MPNLSELNRWAFNSSVLRDTERSKWSQPFEHKTTMLSGKLVPIMCKEVLPGDTFKVDVSAVIRSITPAVPVMDNSYIDLYFFNVPFRLCTIQPNDWQSIIGENFNGPWAQDTLPTLTSTGNVFQIAQFSADYENTGIQAGSLLNYLGLPVLTSAECADFTTNMPTLKIMGYYRIYNEWFRDEATQSPFDIYTEFDNIVAASATRAGLLNSNKIKGDPFCGALPAPQRGASIELPLGASAPVMTSATATVTGSQSPLQFKNVNGNALGNNGWNVTYDGTNNKTTVNTLSSGVGSTGVYPSNLYADLSKATAATINQIRLAFALQRFAERNALGGGRYRSYILSMYGVNIADSIVQVPEYLGGMRMPLNITQVLQTTPVAGASALGSTGAFSNTAFTHKGIIKSFNESGYLYCIATIRTEQSYSQGISKEWYRDSKFDIYNSVFSHIGEQPIYKSELYAKGNPTLHKGAVFGYNEAWYEYRYNPTLVTGYLAPDAGDTTLTAWTYTNNFEENVVLNSSFMVQPRELIDNTLVVEDSAYQFICDFYFPMVTTRPMPLFSVPGLLDHF